VHTRRTTIRNALLAVAALSCASALAGTVPEPRIPYAQGRQIATLANRAIDESSGLACSHLDANVFWTHNDSGGGRRIYAFNRKGEHLGTFAIKGAGTRDWEDMASFALDGKSYLVVGDVGDNPRARSRVALYIVAEPRLTPEHAKGVTPLPLADAIRFVYSDGAHNCEAIAADPTQKLVLLITKEFGLGCTVFALPLKAPADGKPVVAKAIARIAVPVVTAMDISPDGRRCIVLTYLHAFEFVRKPGEPWAKAFARLPRMLPMPPRIQGESICYGADGRTLYLTSEKRPTPLLEVPVAATK